MNINDGSKRKKTPSKASPSETPARDHLPDEETPSLQGEPVVRSRDYLDKVTAAGRYDEIREYLQQSPASERYSEQDISLAAHALDAIPSSASGSYPCPPSESDLFGLLCDARAVVLSGHVLTEFKTFRAASDLFTTGPRDPNVRGMVRKVKDDFNSNMDTLLRRAARMGGPHCIPLTDEEIEFSKEPKIELPE